MTIDKYYNYQSKLINMLNAIKIFEDYKFDVSLIKVIH